MTRTHCAVLVLLAATTVAPVVGADGSAPAAPPPKPFQEPTWPQHFDVDAAESQAYGIVVGKPGSIVVRADAKGPVIVRLLKPNGSVAKEQQGKDAFRMEYACTNEDVALGTGWRLSIRGAAPNPRAARIDKGAAPVLTTGTVSVDHPPGDARTIVIKPPEASPPPPAVDPRALEAEVARLRALRAKERVAKHAQAWKTLEPKLAPAAYAVAASKIAARAGLTVDALGLANKGGSGATSTSQSAATGVVGGNTPQTVAATPSIASISPSAAAPEEQVLLEGSGFGATQGSQEVHFIVAPGKDLVGTVTYWNDTQIIAQVPSIEGVREFPAAQVYIRRGAQSSKLAPFTFEPTMDYQMLPITQDRQGANPWGNRFGHDGWPGMKGDDSFFLHTQLKNGWVLDDAYVVPGPGSDVRAPEMRHGKGDAYVSEKAVNSSTPTIKVHWWGEADSFYVVSNLYLPVVWIRGPKGLSPQ